MLRPMRMVRRRVAVGVGALSVMSVAAAGLAVPSLTGGGDKPRQVAGTQTAPPVHSEERPFRDAGNNQYEIRYGGPIELGSGPERIARAEFAVEGCLRHTEPDYLTRSEATPTLYKVFVVGQAHVEAFEGCVRAIPDVSLKLVTSTRPVGVKAGDDRYGCDDVLNDGQFAGLRLVEAMSAGSSADLCFLAAADKPTSTATEDKPAAVVKVEIRHADGDLRIAPHEFTRGAVDPGDDGPVVKAAGSDRYCPADPDDRLLLQYVGLTEAQARKRGELDGVPVRTACRDGIGQNLTADYRGGRVNLVIDAGRVVRAVQE